MFDGINLQVGLFCLVVFTFFYFNNFSVLFSLIMIVPLVTFLILNYNNKCFLGDSGCYLLAFLIAVIIIHYYNLQLHIDNGNKEVNADHIFILLMLPGIDMLRLFVYRVANGKNPFEGDNHHIHHLFISRYGLNKSNLIIQSIVILPLILMQIFPSLVIIIISLLTYSYLIYFMYLR